MVTLNLSTTFYPNGNYYISLLPSLTLIHDQENNQYFLSLSILFLELTLSASKACSW